MRRAVVEDESVDPSSIKEDRGSNKPDQWARIIETTVIGLIRATRQLITSMVERDFGHIVNIGSIAGLQSYASGSIYSGSKHAVHSSAKACALTMRTPAFG